MATYKLTMASHFLIRYKSLKDTALPVYPFLGGLTMLKSTLTNMRNQSAYKPTASDILSALAICAVVLFTAMMEGGAIL